MDSKERYNYSEDSFESYYSDTESVSSKYNPNTYTQESTSPKIKAAKKIINKKKKENIPAAVKRIVWNKYIGETIGKSKCLCCKVTDITQLSFHCGHVIAEADGGTLDIDNLRPICQNCNSSMRTMNMNEFIEKFKLHGNDIDNKIL